MMMLLRILVLLLALPWLARADAPAHIAGKVYWEFASRPTLRTQYVSVIELHENGTFSERVRTHRYTVSDTTTYLEIRSGTYRYERVGKNAALLEFIPDGGEPEPRELIFEEADAGELERPAEQLIGNFHLRDVRTPDGLLNLSTRVEVRRGSPAIVGFVLAGQHPHQVLVRAVGPSLVGFGIAQPASDPQYLFHNRLLYTPTVAPWAATPEAKAINELAASTAGAFPLLPDSNDKSDVLTLWPGAYTIIVNASTPEHEGTVLLEIYELP